jgi:uncharacterized protein YdhG (YjbR/CyaY superfamily)
MVGFASQKNHLSFYVMSLQLVDRMKEDLKGLQVSGATIHFTPLKPIPKSLIKKIIKARKKEITSSY